MDRGPVGTGKFEESSVVQGDCLNHSRWSYQDENSAKGQKEAVTFSQPQVTSQQSHRGKKCPIHPNHMPSLPLSPAWSPWSQIHPGNQRTREPGSSPDSPGQEA